MENFISFSGISETKTIPLNPENTFFKITKVVVSPKSKVFDGKLYTNSINITFKINSIDESYRTEQLTELNNESYGHHDQIIKIDKILSSDLNNKDIECFFKCYEEYACDVYLYYTVNDKRVDLKNPFEDFGDHLKIHDNVKILFSAPFGQGKTTFLNHFFETNNIKYEVFKLYPVNYSVSHNEDIFKYIKAEILFQLMGKDVEFDKEKFTYLETAPAFFKKNIHNILSPFIGLLPLIGKSAADIYEKLYKLGVEYLDYHCKLKIDDNAKAIQFINELYEKEGSIFEDNFYTQLIRQLLEQHKLKHKKQNVLIIDDIDRMDPDHIFRIFNVFSANFDSNDYRIGLSNKFGFDKIILVCDYDNIKKLFRHKYGSSSAFDGYLSKYYSRTPFYYDNAKAIERFTNNIVYSTSKEVTILGEALLFVLNDFTTTGEITLRDLLKLKKFDYNGTVNKLANVNSKKLKNQMHRFLFFNVIAFLGNIYDLDTIKEKIVRCKADIKFKERPNYSYYTQIALAPLANYSTDNTPRKNVTFLDKSISFIVQEEFDRVINYEYLKPAELKDISGNSIFQFNEKDFYEVLLLNVEKYKEA